VKKLILAASLTLAVIVPETASAQISHAKAIAYGRAYQHTVKKFGKRAAGCKLIGPNSTCHGHASDARILGSLDVLHRMFMPTPSVQVVTHYAPTATTSTYTHTYYHTSAPQTSTSGYGDVPGVPSGFASCVALKESSNGAGSSNIYGIEGAGGQGSLAEQKQAFAQMYGSRGTEPWSPYDHC
jgi:hypothetical protein